ncbi:MAG: TIM barrel protein [Candidatus Micrarchaeota archaeon]|nr:TIM barrel protein [Candidatus Micrarchaeota archaeon]
MRFHSPGIPQSIEKSPNLLRGLEIIKKINLDGMELEFVRNVFIKKENTEEVKKTCENLELTLTVHAPYFINLATTDKKKLEDSINRIVHSAEIGFLCGAKSCCFHPGYYGKLSKSETFKKIFDAMLEIDRKLAEKKVKINIAPETMGKQSQFGSFEELISMCTELNTAKKNEQISFYPCIDFSHLYARDGKTNGYEKFREIFVKYEDAFGKNGLNNMHVHLQGIEFGEKGEKNHLILDESDIKYKDVLKLLKEFNANGYLVCESPNIEIDTLRLKEEYMKL